MQWYALVCKGFVNCCNKISLIRQSMSYYRKNSSSEGFIQGVIYFLIISYIVYDCFKLKGIIIAYGGLVILGVVIEQLIKYKKRKDEIVRAQAPCKHGNIGALYGGQPCAKCQEEKTAAEIVARKKREEEAAKKKSDEERAYKEWVARIRLPQHLSQMDAEEFEHLVCDLFRRLGYEVEHTPFTGDGGIDGYLRKNGQLSILQCKRVKGSVGQPVLRDLFGTMNHEKAKEGIVVTTGRVSKQAREWAQGKAIRILELDELTNLIRENYSESDVVPKEFIPYGVNSALCPKCSRPLRVVKWKGKEFLGCTGYPRCRFTKSLGFRSLDSQKD